MIVRQQISHSRLLLIIASIAALAFVILAIMVRDGQPLIGDVSILQFIHRDFPTWLSRVFLTATELGNPLGIGFIVIFIMLILAYKHYYSRLIIVVTSIALSTVANLIIKSLFKRDRPTLWDSIISAQSFSFPSGHAMASSALVFALAYITWQTRLRWTTIILGSIFIIMVALSRLYFGVHYPSDIIGGWLASLAIVSITIYCVNHFSAAKKGCLSTKP